MKNKIALIALLLLTGCISQSPRPPDTPVVTSDGVVSEIPFTLHDNRMLVNVEINGQGPFIMIFDTGGSNTMTPEVQKLLELKSQGSEYATGAGSKRVRYYSVHVQSLQAGKFKLNDQSFMVLNLNPIRKAFRFSHLDGIVGLEILNQARVRVDFDRQVIQILNENAPPLAQAKILPMDLVGDSPVIQGKINGRDAKILLDTGDRSNLTLFRKFALNNKLDKIFVNRGTVLTGMGIGGPIPGKVSSLDKIELGPEAVTDVMTRLPLTKGGYFHKSNLSASAGIGLLKSFNLEFDYKAKTVALQRRTGYNEPSMFIPVQR